MTATTTETWSVNGTVLNTLAYNFGGLGGRLDGVVLRGKNAQVPYGADTFRSHWYGPRQEQWDMWISDRDPSTDAVGGRAQANTNLDAIKALFQGNPNQTLAVARVVSTTAGLATRTCDAICTGFKVRPNQGGAFFRVTVDVEIPSGLWLGSAGTQTISALTTVTVGGTALVTPDLLTITGNVTVSNSTTNTGFTYTGTGCVFHPKTWTTDTATDISNFSPASLQPLLLAAGDNSIDVTGGGSIQIDWTEGYL